MLNLLRYNAKPRFLALGTVSLLSFMLLISSIFAQNSSPSSSDFNGNGVVDFPDFLLFASAFGSQAGQDRYDAKYDLNGNGEIAFDDFLLFVDSFGPPLPPPGDPRLAPRGPQDEPGLRELPRPFRLGGEDDRAGAQPHPDEKQGSVRGGGDGEGGELARSGPAGHRGVGGNDGQDSEPADHHGGREAKCGPQVGTKVQFITL